MKIGVFAAEDVGLEVVRVFADRNHAISCLVLDHQGDAEHNATIRDLARCDHVFEADRLNDDICFEEIRALGLDLVILAWWPYIIRERQFDLAERGFLNFHPSLLPYNRGKHYYFWNLVEGVPYGVTLHMIDEGIDSGVLAYQETVDTSWEDTGFTIRERGKAAILVLFKSVFARIAAGDIPAGHQDLDAGTFHWGIELDGASQIDLDGTYRARDLLNILRGRSGFPAGGAWFVDEGKKFVMDLRIRRESDE